MITNPFTDFIYRIALIDSNLDTKKAMECISSVRSECARLTSIEYGEAIIRFHSVNEYKNAITIYHFGQTITGDGIIAKTISNGLIVFEQTYSLSLFPSSYEGIQFDDISVSNDEVKAVWQALSGGNSDPSMLTYFKTPSGVLGAAYFYHGRYSLIFIQDGVINHDDIIKAHQKAS